MSQINDPHDRDALMHKNEQIISYILRGGVTISAAVIALGLLLYFIHHPDAIRDVQAITFPATPDAIASGVAHGQARAIIMLGLLLLIATPVTRIAASIVTFALERDWKYVAITVVVLTILIVSFLLGKAGG